MSVLSCRYVIDVLTRYVHLCVEREYLKPSPFQDWLWRASSIGWYAGSSNRSPVGAHGNRVSAANLLIILP